MSSDNNQRAKTPRPKWKPRGTAGAQLRRKLQRAHEAVDSSPLLSALRERFNSDNR